MKLYIGSALYKSVSHVYADRIAELRCELQARGIAYEMGNAVGDALVSRSRSLVASAFLRSDCDVLLTLDDDIWYRPVDAIKLATECDQGRPLIGALYMTRKMDTQPALMLPQDQAVVFEANAKPVNGIPFLSTGFMAVHRRVFERLSQDLPLCHEGWNDRGATTSFWPFYMPYVIPWESEGHMYLSEDWAMCQRAKDAGFGLWLDPSIRLGHMGEEMRTLEDLLRAPKPQAQPIRLELHGNVLEPGTYDAEHWATAHTKERGLIPAGEK